MEMEDATRVQQKELAWGCKSSEAEFAPGSED